jgi:hypothetical protein
LNDKKIIIKHTALITWDSDSIITVFVFGFVCLALVATVLVLMKTDKKKKKNSGILNLCKKNVSRLSLSASLGY